MSKARERMNMLKNARSKGANPRLQSTVKNMNTQDATLNQEIYQDMFKGCKGAKTQKSMARFCDKISDKKFKNPIEAQKPSVIVDPETVYRPSTTNAVKKRTFAKIGAVDIKLQDIVRVPVNQVKTVVPKKQSPAINIPLDRSKTAINNLFRPTRSSLNTFIGSHEREQALKAKRNLTSELEHALFFSNTSDWIININKVELSSWSQKDELPLQRKLLPVYCWLQKLAKQRNYVLDALKSILHSFGVIQVLETHVEGETFLLHFNCFSDNGVDSYKFLTIKGVIN